MALALSLVALATGLIATSTVLVLARGRAHSMPGAFRCMLALTSDSGRRVYRWPRTVSCAVWVHDVLVIFGGPTRTRVRAVAVHFAEGSVTNLNRPVRGLGDAPVVLALELDDGTAAVIAAPRSAGSLVAGPFLAALVTPDDLAAESDQPGS